MKYSPLLTRRTRQTTSPKYSPRPVLVTRNIAVYEHWQQATEADAPLAPRQFVVGTIQHPHTGLYQTWLSTNGLDVVCLSAHRTIMQADAAVRTVKQLIASGDLYDDEKAEACLAQITAESDEEPRTLPDDLVRQICRAILRAVVD